MKHIKPNMFVWCLNFLGITRITDESCPISCHIFENNTIMTVKNKNNRLTRKID